MSGEKSVLVTGSSGGVGQAIARRMVEQGNVLGLDIADPPVGSPWDHVECDLADAASVARVAGLLDADLSSIIHVAADQPLLDATAIDEVAWNRAWAVNVMSLQRIVAAVLSNARTPRLERVVAIGSVHSSATSKSIAPYSVTKAALRAYVRALSIDATMCRDFAAIYVELGATNSAKLAEGMVRRPHPEGSLRRLMAALPVGRLIEPHDVAELVEWLVQPAAIHMSGSSIAFAGGALELLATEVGNE